MTDLKVEYIDGVTGKYASETLNGEHVLELMVKHDMWDIRTTVRWIIKYDLLRSCVGIIDIKEAHE